MQDASRLSNQALQLFKMVTIAQVMPERTITFPKPRILQTGLDSPAFNSTGGSSQGETMTDVKTCANPACSCIPAEKEKYCSPHCEALESSTEVVCKCGHHSCSGAATKP